MMFPKVFEGLCGCSFTAPLDCSLIILDCQEWSLHTPPSKFQLAPGKWAVQLCFHSVIAVLIFMKKIDHLVHDVGLINGCRCGCGIIILWCFGGIIIWGSQEGVVGRCTTWWKRRFMFTTWWKRTACHSKHNLLNTLTPDWQSDCVESTLNVLTENLTV